MLFGIGTSALGFQLSRFLPAFALVFVVSLVLYFLGQWDQASHYNLEPPLVALVLGLVVSNTVGAPAWADAGLRVEFYIKTGIVLLGAGLPLTLIAWAGPVAILQAAIVSLVTFGVIYFTGVRLGLDRRLAATLGTGGAVCGVSGAIATAGAVGARKEHVSIAISLVIFWAIVTIFLLPLLARGLGCPPASPAPGSAPRSSPMPRDSPRLRPTAAMPGQSPASRHRGGRGECIHADESHRARRLDRRVGLRTVDHRHHALGAHAAYSRSRARSRSGGASRSSCSVSCSPRRSSPLISRGYSYADYKKVLLPSLVAPLQALRIWAFTFTFLAIGLTTRLREFVSVGAQAVLRVYRRRGGQHRARLRAVDAGVRGLLDQAGSVADGLLVDGSPGKRHDSGAKDSAGARVRSLQAFPRDPSGG